MEHTRNGLHDFGEIGGRGRRFCFGSKLILKKFVRIAKEIAPDLDVDGGELRNLIDKMMAAHDKYVRKYETLINSKSKIEKKGRESPSHWRWNDV